MPCRDAADDAGRNRNTELAGRPIIGRSRYSTHLSLPGVSLAEQVCYMRFAPVECAQRRRASRRAARDNLSLTRNGQGNPCAKCDKSPEFRKSFPLRVDSADPANVLSGRENIEPGQRHREAGRLTATRQQHRPVRRALGLFCTAFTCLLLLITTLPAPSAANNAAKVLRYGTQKPAGYASFTNERECRKRSSAAKVVPLSNRGNDFACLPGAFAYRSRTVERGAFATLSPGATGRSDVETRRARAPPMVFA